MALMEEYVPGRTENLHDYLIPTIGDVPEIECLLDRGRRSRPGRTAPRASASRRSCPTAPAILGAIRHATGARITRVPATPDRVRAAILAARDTASGGFTI